MFESTKRNLESPRPYSISTEAFLVDPVETTNFEIGMPITRNNFVSLLKKSFAISKGEIEIQIHFLYWLRVKYGFDYKETFYNFMQCGGWDTLSEAEQLDLADAFNAVGAHKMHKTTDMAKLAEAFQKQFSDITDYEHTYEFKKPRVEELLEVETVKELRALAERYMPKNRKDNETSQ